MPTTLRILGKIALASALTCTLAGCGAGGLGAGASNGATSITAASSVGVISGSVHGGQQPVAGSKIQLYAVGASGYNGNATPLIPASAQVVYNAGATAGTTGALTDTSGGFNISGSYTCPAGSYVYITASGGDPGHTGTTNSAIALAAALGPCANLSSSSFINLNEVTTVAMAYAMAQFSLASSFGTTLVAAPGSASSAPADNFATSATNVQGIANAMAIANVIASTASGTSPGNNVNGTATVEYWQVNAIANILSGCVNSTATGGVTSACTTLFANVNLPTGTNPHTSAAYAAPADTLQAALYLALNPTVSSTSTTNLIGLASAFAPFNPAASTIYDFSLAVSYNPVVPGSSTQLAYQTASVALDQYGNAWILNALTATTAAILEVDPTGNPVQAGSTLPGTPTAANYQITGFSVGGSTTNSVFGGPTTSAVTPHNNVAVDTSNNIWVPDYTNSYLFKIAGSGPAIGVGTGFSNGFASTLYNGGNGQDGGGNGATGISFTATSPATSAGRPTDIAIDGANDVFVMNIAGTAGTTCLTGVGSVAAIPSTSNKGMITLVGGSTTNINYGPAQGNATYNPLVIDSGTNDSAGGTAIPGAPFVYSYGYNAGSRTGNQLGGTGSGASTGAYPSVLSQNYTTTSGSATVGCATPLGGISSIDNAGATTQIPASSTALVPAVANEYGLFMSGPTGMAADGQGNLWIANTSVLDTTSATYSATTTSTAGTSALSGLSKLTLNYGSAFTPASTAAASSFSVYHDIAGISGSTSQPRTVTTDGGGNAWFTLSNASGSFGAITASGAAFSPNYASTNIGFQGGKCPSTCYFTGSTTAYVRKGYRSLAVDASGNVWAGSNSSTYPKITVLIGSAVPTTTPAAVGLKNGTFGARP